MSYEMDDSMQQNDRIHSLFFFVSLCYVVTKRKLYERFITLNISLH